MNSDVDWAAHAKRFQLDLGTQWTQALQSVQHGAPGLPSIRFAAEKLQELQTAYVHEASQLWNQGLTDRPAPADKRFAGDAWSRNPVAAFSASVYLLNARTLLGLAEAADTDVKTKARLRFRGRAVDGRFRAEQLHGAER
jgi:polyhydroxyalkanoate synthase